MFPSWRVLLARMAHVVVLIFALGALSDQAFADDGDDDDDDDDIPALTTGPMELRPGDVIANLFATLSRMPNGDAACPTTGALLVAPLPESDSYACVVIVNIGDAPGIWRIDFEESFGAEYRFEVVRGQTPSKIVLNNSADAASRVLGRDGSRLASQPIVLAPSEAVTLRVRISAPSDLVDADPLLRPEIAFDEAVANRAHGFGGLIGASVILIIFYVAFGQLLGSRPARFYAYYFTTTVLVAASNEGNFTQLIATNALLINSLFNKGFEAAQIAFHLLFVAAFVRDALPNSQLPRAIQTCALIGVATLMLAAALAVGTGGMEGWLQYHDLGMELDPLLEDPSLPLFLGALVPTLWIGVMIMSATVLQRRGASGASLFSLGTGFVVLALVFNSFGDTLLDDWGEDGVSDDQFWFQYVLLFDGLLFAAAIVRQTFGLREERNKALALELVAVREQARLSATLLETRQDRDRAQGLAESHRARLALAGHDLSQPLTSLRLAIDDADSTNPALGDKLRSNLDYLAGLLHSTLAETRPEEIADTGHEVPQTGAEAVPLEMAFSNAVRMFRDEAEAKALEICADPTDYVVHADPIGLIRMISNLVSNAVKYTQTGSVTLSARKQEDGSYCIYVRDTGPGLTSQEIETITQSYQRGSNIEDVSGTGLGLSSVKENAARMSLRFEIESIPGEGSCFSLCGFQSE